MTELAMQIMDFFQHNQDKRYRTHQISKHLGVKTKDVTPLMSSLPIDYAVEGKDRVYFMVSDEVKARLVKRNISINDIPKAKRDNRLMSINLDRCKELYPNGGNFKSIS